MFSARVKFFLPCRKELADGKEEDAASKKGEAHVEDVVNVDGVAHLASLSLLCFVLLVGVLLGLIYTTVKNINVIFLIGYFRQKKYGIKVRLHVREQTRQCSKLTGFSVSFFSSLGITEFCRLRRAVFLGEVSWDRDRLRFCRDPALAGLSDPECSDTFLSRCSLSARFSANSS